MDELDRGSRNDPSRGRGPEPPLDAPHRHHPGHARPPAAGPEPAAPAASGPPVVRVLEDDGEARRRLVSILDRAGHRVRAYAAAAELVRRWEAECHDPGCIVLELELPNHGGDEVLDALDRHGWSLPAVIVTAHDGAERTARAFRNGAIDLLRKPVDEARLLAAVAEAIELDRTQRARRSSTDDAQRRVGALTQRELDVIRKILDGCSNRQASARLGIATKTVEYHRSRAMKKLGVDSVPALVRLAIAAGLIEAF